MALMFAEELTRIPDRFVREEVRDQVQEQFEVQELNDLLWVIAAINTWNRVNVGSRKPPGDYQPAAVRS